MIRRSFHVKCEQDKGVFFTYAYAWSHNVSPPDNPPKLVCLFDTGSDIGIINIDTANRLGIYASGEFVLNETAGGASYSGIYIADICLPGGMVFKKRKLKGIHMPMDIVIGMDIITLGKISFRYQDPHLNLSFSSNKYDVFLHRMGSTT